MKEKRARLNTKKKLENDKLALKQEKLRQIDEENEKQRKNIIKKIKKMEKKKLELDKQKDERFQQKKEEMGMKFQDTIDNKNILSKEADEKREEVLEYESYIFNIVKKKEAGNFTKRTLSQNRTIQNQKDNQKKIRQFQNIMNSLQDVSVNNKNDKQKRKMYNEKVRKDLEEKRKEEEKRLEEIGLI
jgi:hypothetical protein